MILGVDIIVLEYLKNWRKVFKIPSVNEPFFWYIERISDQLSVVYVSSSCLSGPGLLRHHSSHIVPRVPVAAELPQGAAASRQLPDPWALRLPPDRAQVGHLSEGKPGSPHLLLKGSIRLLLSDQCWFPWLQIHNLDIVSARLSLHLDMKKVLQSVG